MSEFRPYQREAFDNTLVGFGTHRSVLLNLATGTGKTFIFSHVGKHYASQGGGVLVLEHSQELVEQTARQVARWAKVEVGIEMAEQTCIGKSGRPPVIVASVPSLRQPARLEAYDPQSFSLVIVDEAHHALAGGYRVILDRFASAKLLGVTATPDRHDRQALGQIFETVAFSFTLEDAIRGRWLVPIRQTRVVVESLDFSRVRSTTAGDLNEEDLARVLLEEQHLHAVAGAAFQHAGDRRTLVFASSVEHAHQLAAVMLRIRERSAEAIDGTANATKRSDVLARFRSGKTQFLVNCGMYLEGFDEPSISCIVVARPTESRALYAQMIGRGTRLSSETGKQDLLVLDFVGNAGKHHLVSSLDILGGEVEDRVHAAAQAIADRGMPVLEALAQGRAQVEAEDKLQQEAVIAQELRRGVVGIVHSRLEEVVDGFAFYGFDPKTARTNGADVTPKQVAWLRDIGTPPKEIAQLDRAQASEYLGKVKDRRDAGLCTQEQARQLARYGVDARVMMFHRAKSLLETYRRNGWPMLPSEKRSPRRRTVKRRRVTPRRRRSNPRSHAKRSRS